MNKSFVLAQSAGYLLGECLGGAKVTTSYSRDYNDFIWELSGYPLYGTPAPARCTSSSRPRPSLFAAARRSLNRCRRTRCGCAREASKKLLHTLMYTIVVILVGMMVPVPASPTS